MRHFSFFLFLFVVFILPGFALGAQRLEFFPDFEKPSLSKSVEKLPELLLVQNGMNGFSVRVKGGATNKRAPEAIQDFSATEVKGVRWSLYALSGLDLKKSSAGRGAPGFVEDVLIPNTLLQNEKFRVPKEAWSPKPTYFFQARTTSEAVPGIFKAQIKFRVGKERFEFPVSLKIVNLKLAKTFKLKTSFGFSPSAVIKKHGVPYGKPAMALLQEYVDLAHEHHIDFHKFYLQFPSMKEQKTKSLLLRANAPGQSFLELWSSWADPAKAHAFVTSDLPVPEEMKTPAKEKDSGQTRSFWNELNSSVVQNGLKEKTFVYFVDEPTQQQTSDLTKNLKLVHGWAPDLKIMITSTYRPEWEGLVQIWCMNLAQWGQPESRSPEFYQRRKDEFWFYVSCNAHGCTGAENLQTPDLVIDRATAYTRAFPWFAARYGASGILYYDTVYSYSRPSSDDTSSRPDQASPWTEPYAFTGNGEGNLFYPCTPDLCGVQAVLPSFRLKILELGLQDVEILNTLPLRPSLERVIKNSRSFPLRSTDYSEMLESFVKDSPGKR